MAERSRRQSLAQIIAVGFSQRFHPNSFMMNSHFLEWSNRSSDDSSAKESWMWNRRTLRRSSWTTMRWRISIRRQFCHQPSPSMPAINRVQTKKNRFKYCLQSRRRATSLTRAVVVPHWCCFKSVTLETLLYIYSAHSAHPDQVRALLVCRRKARGAQETW